MRDRTIFFENGPRAIVIFHAFTSTPNDVLSLARALQRAGYTVYAPTFSGHGTEDPDDIFDHGIESWRQDAEDAYAFLEDKGYNEIAAFGLSLGGILATYLMLNKEVKAAGTFASPVINNERNNVTENFMPWYGEMKKNLGKSDQEIAGLKTAAEPKLKLILSDLNDFVEKMVPQYSKVDTPVFIAQGGKDEMISPHLSGDYRDALESTRVDFHWYDNAPHVITTGKYGKELQVDLLSFLSSIDWNGGNI